MESQGNQFTYLARDDGSRIRFLIRVQIAFPLVSLISGGFRFAWWSILDSALFLVALGALGLAPVFDEVARARIIRLSVALYLAGVLDTALNVVLSGVYGWRVVR